MARSRVRPGPRQVPLGADLRIGGARELFESLAGAAEGGDVELDGSQVERVDAAGLQALAAGLMRLRASKVACRWTGVSPALSGAASLAGLDALLDLR